MFFLYFQGVVPTTDFLKGQFELTEAGCLRVDHEYQSNIPGVFAVGDVLYGAYQTSGGRLH
ncbi:MAG TPA: FAD-dependent oxidoreductase [Anaerolineaceae bacterium]|nr:FAD-dependent oxidoreductase [Anaerolineaceae bacterium]